MFLFFIGSCSALLVFFGAQLLDMKPLIASTLSSQFMEQFNLSGLSISEGSSSISCPPTALPVTPQASIRESESVIIDLKHRAASCHIPDAFLDLIDSYSSSFVSASSLAEAAIPRPNLEEEGALCKMWLASLDSANDPSQDRIAWKSKRKWMWYFLLRVSPP